jgi:hypothetical protein
VLLFQKREAVMPGHQDVMALDQSWVAVAPQVLVAPRVEVVLLY